MDRILTFKTRWPTQDFLQFTYANAEGARSHLLPLDIYLEARVDPIDLGGAFGWQGRWVVDCACHGSELVNPDMLIFMCCSCSNKAHEGQWLKVRLPENRLEIEEELLKRPARERRWSGESIERTREITCELITIRPKRTG